MFLSTEKTCFLYSHASPIVDAKTMKRSYISPRNVKSHETRYIVLQVKLRQDTVLALVNIVDITPNVCTVRQSDCQQNKDVGSSVHLLGA